MFAQQTPSPDPPALEVAYCGARPQKPPLKKLLFNITLRNRADHTRWFLLPRALYDQPVSLSKRSIDAVEVRSAAPPNRLFVADFMGSAQLQPESAGGFQGVLLPAGARVTIRSFPIALWGETDKPLPVRLVIADEFTVTELPAAQWLSHQVLSSAEADADLEEMSPSPSQHSADMQPLPIEIRTAQEFTVPNALAAARCPDKKPVVETPLTRLTRARSVMVVRSRGSLIPYDVIKSTVEGWGRFVLVENPDQADLVIQVATTGGEGDIRITSSSGPSLQTGKYDSSTHTSKDLSSAEVSMTVLDAKNRRVLWNATETAKYAMKQTSRENNLVEAAEKLVSKFHDRLESPSPAAKN